MDITKYYPSIRHDLLKEKYRKLFKDADLLWLIDEIVDSTDEDIGVPIGNYMSQWSGNFFLSDFDHWCKEKKKLKYYYRYMDDVVILAVGQAGIQSEALHGFHDLFGEAGGLRHHLKVVVALGTADGAAAQEGTGQVGTAFFGGHELLHILFAGQWGEAHGI